MKKSEFFWFGPREYTLKLIKCVVLYLVLLEACVSLYGFLMAKDFYPSVLFPSFFPLFFEQKTPLFFLFLNAQNSALVVFFMCSQILSTLLGLIFIESFWAMPFIIFFSLNIHCAFLNEDTAYPIVYIALIYLLLVDLFSYQKAFKNFSHHLYLFFMRAQIIFMAVRYYTIMSNFFGLLFFLNEKTAKKLFLTFFPEDHLTIVWPQNSFLSRVVQKWVSFFLMPLRKHVSFQSSLKGALLLKPVEKVFGKNKIYGYSTKKGVLTGFSFFSLWIRHTWLRFLFFPLLFSFLGLTITLSNKKKKNRTNIALQLSIADDKIKDE